MTLFTDNHSESFLKMDSGILIPEPKRLILTQGIITMDMATDEEKQTLSRMR